MTTSVTPLKQKRNRKKDWKEDFHYSMNGMIKKNAHNMLLIFKNDENLKGKFAYNLLTRKSEIIGNVPWVRADDSKTLSDFDDACLRNYISVTYDIEAKELIYDTLNEIILQNKYHPIRDFLNKVRGKWDGISRIDTLLIDFFDAEDNELNRYQTRLALIGAVKRAFQSGCKFDYVLTLKGDQGLGKSSFFERLAFNKEWFTDSLDEIRGKDAKEQIQGKWIIELGEMAAVGKGDQKRIKQFITSTADEFRQSYGRRTNHFPRQCIFVATTNDDHPLKDDTGGRRWWIVEVKSRWFEKNKPLEVEQIWAEAVKIYDQMERNNEPLKLPNHLEEQAKKIQNENTDKGLYSAEIEFILQRGYIEKSDINGAKIKEPINETCAYHVWSEVLGRYKHDINKATAREINAVLKNLDGWECIGRRQFKDYGKQTIYKRIE